MKVQRHHISDFLKVEDSFVPMGTGFNSLNESPNSQVDTKTYINEKSASSTVKGYQTEFSFDSDLITDEKAIMKLYEVGRNQLTGTDAEAEYLRIDLFSEYEKSGPEGTLTKVPGTYKARLFNVTIQVDSNEGAGGENVKVSGILKGNGTPIFGGATLVKDESTGKITGATFKSDAEFSNGQ